MVERWQRYTLSPRRAYSVKYSDSQKFAFEFGKPFSKSGIMQTRFGNRRISGIVFCPIGGIGLLTEFFNRMGSLQPFAAWRHSRASNVCCAD